MVLHELRVMAASPRRASNTLSDFFIVMKMSGCLIDLRSLPFETYVTLLKLRCLTFSASSFLPLTGSGRVLSDYMAVR